MFRPWMMSVGTIRGELSSAGKVRMLKASVSSTTTEADTDDPEHTHTNPSR